MTQLRITKAKKLWDRSTEEQLKKNLSFYSNVTLVVAFKDLPWCVTTPFAQSPTYHTNSHFPLHLTLIYHCSNIPQKRYLSLLLKIYSKNHKIRYTYHF